MKHCKMHIREILTEANLIFNGLYVIKYNILLLHLFMYLLLFYSHYFTLSCLSEQWCHLATSLVLLVCIDVHIDLSVTFWEV